MKNLFLFRGPAGVAACLGIAGLCLPVTDAKDRVSYICTIPGAIASECGFVEPRHTAALP